MVVVVLDPGDVVVVDGEIVLDPGDVVVVDGEIVLDPGDVVVVDGEIVDDGDVVVVEDDGAAVVVVVDESLGTGTGTTTVEVGGVDTTGAGVLMTVGFSHALIAMTASEAASNTEYFISNSPVIKKMRTECGCFRTWTAVINIAIDPFQPALQSVIAVTRFRRVIAGCVRASDSITCCRVENNGRDVGAQSHRTAPV